MKRHISLLLTIVLLLSCLSVYSSAETVTFSDVSKRHWFADAAHYCFVLAYIHGTDDGVFSPSAKLTRAMACQLIYQHGADKPGTFYIPFVDVKSCHWFFESVSWAYDSGITSGTSDNTFSPLLNITRQDFICMLYRYSEDKQITESNIASFADYEGTSEYAKEAMTWAYSRNIISGYPDNTLKPKVNISRAEAAVLLKSYDEGMGHRWTVLSKTERTCTKRGTAEYYCEHCDTSKTVITKAYHTWSKPTVTKQPMCFEDGTKSYTCLSCLQTKVEVIAQFGRHNWTSKITSSPTCFKDGYKKHTCTRCGKSYAELLPKIGRHVYTGWYTETEATRSVTGVKVNKCIYCNYKQTELFRHSSYYQLADSINIPSGGYDVSTRNIGMKVIYTNAALLGTTSASFTQETKNAVMNFQSRNGLPRTGIVDLNTWLTMGYTEYDWYNLAAYITPRKVTPSDSGEAHIEAMISTASEYARAYTEYRIGASGEPGSYADCSGLIYQCLYSVGINPDTNIIDHGLAEYEYTSRWLAADSKLGLSVPVSQIQRGDLVFYANNGTSRVIHVAIYAGDGMIYDAWPDIGTTYRSINIRGAYVVKAIRVFP